MRILVIPDIHIEEKAISEISNIIFEITSIKADIVVQLGDFYDKNRPTPYELKFGTTIAQTLVDKYGKVIILSGTGKHDILNNTSIIEYLESVGVIVAKKDFVYNNILFGHFMLHESKLEYGTGKCGIKDLKKYKYVFLGHQHTPQKLADNIFHVGSIRYVNWNEVNDEYKRVYVIEDDKVTEIPLKSPIKMVDVNSIEELPNEKLKNCKVRLVISSFNQFKKSIDKLTYWKDKFVEFKTKLDFEQDLNTSKTSIEKANKQKKLQDIIDEGLRNVKDKEVRELLQQQFKEE